MRDDFSTIGVANPYALAEVALGRRVDWRRVENPKALVETTLGMPWEKLIDPRSGSILFPGLVVKGKQLERVPDKDRKADIERRLGLHRTFKPSVPLRRVSPAMRAVLDRPLALAAQRLRFAVQASLATIAEGEAREDLHLTDQGSFFADAAEGGDPVQRGVGDCYFIAALDAVAWSIPSQIRWGPPRAGVAPTDAAGTERGSIRFSPGYYHAGDFDRAGTIVSSGPLRQSVTLNELLPATPEGVPLYAQSSDAGETWPGLYEKAFAVWRGRGVVRGIDYDRLGGGDCGEATRALVGRDWRLDRWSVRDESVNDIYQIVREHSRGGRTFHPMTAWTPGVPDDLPPDEQASRRDSYDRADIALNHCYAVLGWIGVDHVVLRNPWGFQGAAPGYRLEAGSFHALTLNSNGVFAMPIRQFRRFFEGLVVAYP
jgi:hypothetical protein